MKNFVSMNPGFKSRFTRYIEFDDYSPTEMVEIFVKFAGEGDYDVAPELKKLLKSHFISVLKNCSKDIGNARYVRNMFEKSMERHASRVLTGKFRDKKSLSLLTDEDLDLTIIN